jgi:hypothetical protein
MNLLHHVLVAEHLRERISIPEELRGEMLLGAIAPDAHTEDPDVGRADLHLTGDLVEGVLRLMERYPDAERRCAAFTVSVIAHLVADEITRPPRYRLPDYAPTGLISAEDAPDGIEAAGVADIAAIRRTLIATRSECPLGRLPAAAIGRKRWQLLERWPLSADLGRALVLEPLATVVAECADEALARLYQSHEGAALLGDCYPR